MSTQQVVKASSLKRVAICVDIDNGQCYVVPTDDKGFLELKAAKEKGDNDLRDGWWQDYCSDEGGKWLEFRLEDDYSGDEEDVVHVFVEPVWIDGYYKFNYHL